MVRERILPFVLAGLVGLAALAPLADASAQSWVAPEAERTISAPSRPAIAAWGLAFNPVSGEFAVGDYISNQVRRYSRDGQHLGEFSNPRGNTQGVASALGVDVRDGSVYLSVVGDGKTSRSVRKYSAAGEFLFDFNLSGSVTWLTVDEDGYVWAPRGFGGTAIAKWRVDDATRTATKVLEFGSGGSGPGQLKYLTGIAVDAAGNSYVADPGNGRVHAFDAAGRWRFDLGADGRFPGDIRGVVVDDAAQRLYVANSHAGTIEAFDLDGTHLDTFAGPGAGDGQFIDGARQLALTPDGHVWAADYGSRRVLEFAPDGTYLSKFPGRPMLADDAGLTSPRGIAWDPVGGSVLTADSWNQRIQRFAPDGALLRAFGQRGTYPPAGMNYPRSVGVDPATGNIWVVNYEGRPFTSVYDNDFTFLFTVDTVKFSQDIDFHDGLAYMVVRRTPAGVRIYDAATGAEVRQCCGNYGNLRGIAVDPATGNMWLTSDSSNALYVVDRNGAQLQKLAVDKRAWGIDIVGDVVYVADASANKIIAFDRTTYQRLGSFGSAGKGLGQFKGPSGITHDDQGRLYVVEDRGARIQVFTPQPLPAPESNAPSTAFSGVSAALPVVVSGTASDDSGVGRVEVVVKDNATGLFWNATATTWGTSTWNQAIMSGPATDVQWRFTVVPAEPGHSYTVRYRAYDVHGNPSAVRGKTFTTPAG